jgi:ParB-like chromosome segregation protein Spo0J
MKKPDELQGMTVEQLVERFVVIALDQDKALLRREHARFNRLFDEMEAVEGELKARDGDQRQALLSLYDHPNTQVRVKAVKATLAVAPEPALRQLKEIAESRKYPQAGEAGMSLLNLERGIFKPS